MTAINTKTARPAPINAGNLPTGNNRKLATAAFANTAKAANRAGNFRGNVPERPTGAVLYDPTRPLNQQFKSPLNDVSNFDRRPAFGPLKPGNNAQNLSYPSPYWQHSNYVPSTEGNDWLNGSFWNDYINGRNGNDVIFSGYGDDRVAGGNGHDYVNAGQGNDIIYEGQGNDYIDGGQGNDTVVYHGNSNDYWVRTYSNGQTVVWSAEHGYDILNNVEQIRFNDKTVDLSKEPGRVIYGTHWSDQLVGGEGDDKIFGGYGNDVIWGQGGDDHIEGGQGNDWISGGAGNNTVDGGAGYDTAIFEGNRDQYEITPISRDYPASIQMVTNKHTGERTTVRHVEALRFADQTVQIGRPSIFPPVNGGKPDFQALANLINSSGHIKWVDEGGIDTKEAGSRIYSENGKITRVNILGNPALSKYLTEQLKGHPIIKSNPWNKLAISGGLVHNGGQGQYSSVRALEIKPWI